MPWIKTVKEQELIECSKATFEYKEQKLLIIWSKNQAYALENQCSHAFKPLTDAKINNGIIECPFHGGRFCIKTGDHLSPPAFKGITTFLTRIEDGYVEIFFS